MVNVGLPQIHDIEILGEKITVGRDFSVAGFAGRNTVADLPAAECLQHRLCCNERTQAGVRPTVLLRKMAGGYVIVAQFRALIADDGMLHAE